MEGNRKKKWADKAKLFALKASQSRTINQDRWRWRSTTPPGLWCIQRYKRCDLFTLHSPPSFLLFRYKREREKCQLVYPAADFLPLYFRFPFSDTQKSHQKYNMESLVVEMTTGTTSKLFEASVAVFMRRDGSRQRDEKMENEKKKKKIVENPSSRPSFPFNCARYWRPATT